MWHIEMKLKCPDRGCSDTQDTSYKICVKLI